MVKTRSESKILLVKWVVKPLMLMIELVPESSWSNNLRNILGKDAWRKLRTKILKDAQYTCGICGQRSRFLHCHEKWVYDDENHTQKLEGLIPLCKMCHAVKHIGFAKLQADRGELDWEKMVEHFMKINGCNKKMFEKHHQNAAKIWIERSKYQWEVIVGDIKLSEAL